MAGNSRRVSSTADIRVKSPADLQSASLRSSKVPGGGPPALLTRMSIVPKRSRAAPASASICSTDVRSVGTPSTATPSASRAATALAILSSLRAQITRFAPALAKPMADAKPRP